MEVTNEKVIAARTLADKAERTCTKMSVYVAQMQNMRDYYNNELKVCMGEKKAEAEKNFVMYNQLLSDAHTKWNAALDKHGELWETYCELLNDYEEKERNANRPPEKCTFCGEMDCEGDHGDEMRQIVRESGGW